MGTNLQTTIGKRPQVIVVIVDGVTINNNRTVFWSKVFKSFKVKDSNFLNKIKMLWIFIIIVIYVFFIVYLFIGTDSDLSKFNHLV